MKEKLILTKSFTTFSFAPSKHLRNIFCFHLSNQHSVWSNIAQTFIQSINYLFRLLRPIYLARAKTNLSCKHLHIKSRGKRSRRAKAKAIRNFTHFHFFVYFRFSSIFILRCVFSATYNRFLLIN